MAPHTWSHLGDTVSDTTHHMYYRGQRIKEAYYRGECIWRENNAPKLFDFYFSIAVCLDTSFQDLGRLEESESQRLQAVERSERIFADFGSPG